MADTEVETEVEEIAPIEIDLQSLKQARGLVGATDLPGHPEMSTMVLALAAMTEGATTIVRCSRRPEVMALADPLSRLGASVVYEGETATVTGGPLKASDEVLEAKTPTAFACLCGLLAGAPFGGRVTAGDDHKKTGRAVLDALEGYGVVVRTGEASPFPAEIGANRPKPGSYSQGAPDSAVKAAVFLGAMGQSGTFELTQDLAGEDDLEVLFRRAQIRLDKGRAVDGDGYRVTLEGGVSPTPRDHILPGDATAATALLGLAAMLQKSDFAVVHANTDWKTRRLIDLLRRLNVTVDIDKTRTEAGTTTRGYRMQSKGDLRRIKISGEYSALFLDEIPMFATIASVAQGETVIRDVAALRAGPTDLISLMAENLRRLDVRVGEMPDGWVIEGTTLLQGAELDGGGDARMTFAASSALPVSQASKSAGSTITGMR